MSKRKDKLAAFAARLECQENGHKWQCAKITGERYLAGWGRDILVEWKCSRCGYELSEIYPDSAANAGALWQALYEGRPRKAT